MPHGAHGQRLAVAVADTLRVVRRSGIPLATLSLRGHPASSLAWSPDGKTVASAGWDGTVRLWTMR